METGHIGVDVDGDIIFFTVAKYKLFMSYDKVGMDALLLYCHYMFTARLQSTNSVKANNVYVRQGLHWTKERLGKAKTLLSDLGLIAQVRRIDEKTKKVLGYYVEVKTQRSPFEIKSVAEPSVRDSSILDFQEGGNLTTNALTNNQMLERENKVPAVKSKLNGTWKMMVDEIFSGNKDLGLEYSFTGYEQSSAKRILKILESETDDPSTAKKKFFDRANVLFNKLENDEWYKSKGIGYTFGYIYKHWNNLREE